MNGDGYSDIAVSYPSIYDPTYSYASSRIDILYGGTTAPTMNECTNGSSVTFAKTNTIKDITIFRDPADLIRLTNGGDINADGFDEPMQGASEDGFS